jgi:hypothetical protein
MPLEQVIGWIQSPAVQENALALGVTLLGEFVRRVLAARAKVKWGLTHAFFFLIPYQHPPQPPEALPPAPMPDLKVQVTTLVLQNVGRASAENIEIHLNYRPTHFEVWPTFDFSVSAGANGRFFIKLANLGDRERATIELMQIGAEVPRVIRVRTPIGEANQVPLDYNEVLPKWAQFVLFGIVLLGAFTIVRVALALASALAGMAALPA